MYLYAIGFLVLSAVIHRLAQQQTSPTLIAPDSVINCLRYTQQTNSFARNVYYQVAKAHDSILNPDNIAAFLGSQAEDCHLFIHTLEQAYSSGPLAKSIFKITLGKRRDLKYITAAKELAERNAVAAHLPNANIIAVNLHDQTNDFPILVNPSNAMRHETTHAFIKLYNEKFASQLTQPEFYNKANEEFAKALAQVYSLKRDRYDYDEIENLHYALRIVENNLKQFANPSERAEETFTHLLHLVPEYAIKKYFGFFYNQFLVMIDSFSYAELLPHDKILDADESYHPSHAFALQHTLNFQRIDVEDIRGLINQFHRAVKNNDKPDMQLLVNFFLDSNIVTKINLLKTKNEFAYVQCHLLAAEANLYLGNKKAAYEHFQKGWEIDHSRKFETYQFTGNQVMKMIDLGKQFKNEEINVKPLTNSMKRAAKRING